MKNMQYQLFMETNIFSVLEFESRALQMQDIHSTTTLHLQPLETDFLNNTYDKADCIY